MITKQDWENVPDWANWVAVDSDGEVYAFENKPTIDEGVWEITSGEAESLGYTDEPYCARTTLVDLRSGKVEDLPSPEKRLLDSYVTVRADYYCSPNLTRYGLPEGTKVEVYITPPAPKELTPFDMEVGKTYKITHKGLDWWEKVECMGKPQYVHNRKAIAVKSLEDYNEHKKDTVWIWCQIEDDDNKVIPYDPAEDFDL